MVKESIDPMLLNPEILINSELEFSEISPKFYRILKQFAPFGPGNSTPVFLSRNLKETGYGKCVGEDKTHLRITVKQGNSPQYVGIGFGLGSKKDIACSGDTFKAAYVIDENEWQGRVSLQLRLKDIKP